MGNDESDMASLTSPRRPDATDRHRLVLEASEALREDDLTDVDAFRGLDELSATGGIATVVKVGVRSDEGPPALEQEATFMVDGTDGVRALLQTLAA